MFKSKHNLEFVPKEDGVRPNDEIRIRFTLGTCNGLYEDNSEFLNLFGIFNSEPGNGHFDDVLEWFEYMCKRDNKDFLITWLDNQNLRDHLLKKRSFLPHGPRGVRKNLK